VTGPLRRAAVWLATCALAVPIFAQTPATPRYEVYALRFATIPSFRVASLVDGADRSRTLDIAMMVWVIKGEGRTVLVDSGFYRDKFMQQWKPTGYAKPSEALSAALGIAPAQVTDIIVSHIHWDHADGLDLFPNAQIWIQREEYEYYVGDAGVVLHNGIDALDAAMLASLKAAGRVRLVEGDNQAVMPGVTVYTGGKHTYASQYVGVATRSGIVVLASDNCYLYENLERHAAIAQTLDKASNLAAQERMTHLAASPRLVVPGHDPAVFERFPSVRPNLVRID
jgi:glyoxylase-like metal-dependent hydrolase (beta-lactamase superfamily II)